MSMEFIISTDMTALPKRIDFNFEQLKGQLGESLEYYSGLVVTEDSIKSAKEERAKLNKLRDALENKRKEVKKECLAPYTDFEGKVKELVELVDKPITAIDEQLRQFEDARRSEKRETVLEEYDRIVGEMRMILPFEKVWRDEWYNLSSTMKKIRDAIAETVSRVESDLKVLDTVDGEFAEAVKLKYLERYDLSEALAERKRLADEAEKLRAFEESAAEADSEEAPSSSAVEETGSTPQDETDGQLYLLRFECSVTKHQAAELAQYLKSNNIEYRRV